MTFSLKTESNRTVNSPSDNHVPKFQSVKYYWSLKYLVTVISVFISIYCDINPIRK